jgi:hypothetical protein
MKIYVRIEIVARATRTAKITSTASCLRIKTRMLVTSWLEGSGVVLAGRHSLCLVAQHYLAPYSRVRIVIERCMALVAI